MLSKKNIFIIIPKIDNTSPINGALTLGNLLAKDYNVSLVSLNSNFNNKNKINGKINLISLRKEKTFIQKIIKIISIIKKNEANKNNTISISFTLIPDILNIFLNKYSLTTSFLRGNYNINYIIRFNIFGYLLTKFHDFILNRLRLVIVMNKFMKTNISKRISTKIKILGNFIDEEKFNLKKLNKVKKFNKITFCFVGRLSKIKKVEQLIFAFSKLYKKNKNVQLMIIGSGENTDYLKKIINAMGLNKIIKFRGYMKNPEIIMVKCHCLVLPSVSEGTSRAVLEAQYLGIKCILRDVTGNKELVKSKTQGLLFQNDSDLPKALLKMDHLQIKEKSIVYNNLLNKQNTRSFVSNKFKSIFGS